MKEVAGYQFPDFDDHWHKIAFAEIPNLAAVCDLVKGRDCVVQAGGNVGIFANHLAELFGRVYTFEPDNDNWECLRRNCTRKNILAYHAGLGDKPGFCHMTGTRIDSGWIKTTAGGQILQTTIDALTLDACDLIYLDVEGAESAALRGAMDTINQFKPVLACEMKGLDPSYRQPAAFRGWIESLGYVYHGSYGHDDVFLPV